MHSLFWFRRDLRLDDNTALYHALSSGHAVVPIFIFDTDILEQLEDRDDARVTFIHKTLSEIDAELRKFGSALQVYFGRPESVFKKLFSEGKYESLFLNGDYEPYAIERDLEVQRVCSSAGVSFKSFKDQVIFEKLEVAKPDGSPYRVFTPYKNKWLKILKSGDYRAYKSEKLLGSFAKLKVAKFPSLAEIGFEKSSIEVPDAVFAKQSLKNYARVRNRPAADGTSKIGTHLRFGTVSVREAVRTALKASDVWLSELIWREFFMQLLFNSPHVIEMPAKENYRNIKWRNDEKEFAKWCEGKTGFPIVDAGMRELNATGYMHNRVRMIAASLLVKHLLVDYRWGETYFARKLLDFELSSNNGNWQWVAGTGSDASPYFRVFSPATQQKKFDSKFEYIQKWVPEFGTSKYPEPIVEHEFARDRAIEAYGRAVKPTRS